jgi:hypothetical protein
MNAVQHGLLARAVLLPNESGEAFRQLHGEFYAALGARNGIEVQMIEELAAANWRLRRAWTVEKTTLTQALAHQPPGDEQHRLNAAFIEAAADPHFTLLSRYETRLHTMYRRSLRNILDLRAANREAEAAEPKRTRPNETSMTPYASPPRMKIGTALQLVPGLGERPK